MRAIALAVVVGCSFISSANAQRALAMIEGYCNEEFDKSKKPESEREAHFEACFKRKRAENERAVGGQPRVPVGMKASFDCSKAKSGSARLICSDPALSEADRELGETFQSVIGKLDAAQKKVRLEEQVKWIRERNTRCNLDNKQDSPVTDLKPSWGCMMDALVARKSELTGKNTQTGQAREPSVASGIRSSQYSQMLDGQPQALCDGREKSVSATIKEQYGPALVDGNSIRGLLTYLNGLSAPCVAPNKFVHVLVINTGRINGVSTDGVNWTLEENGVGQALEVRRQQQLALAKAQEQAQAEQRRIAGAKAKALSDLGIQAVLEGAQLNANPFIFKNTVIGIFATFDHMISETEAVFDAGVGGALYVASVPPALFRGREYILLSGRVTGKHSVKSNIGTDLSLPALDYLGSYSCAQNACQGF